MNEWGIHAERGDLMFTRGHTGLGAAIRWVERGRGESPTWANHVGLVSVPGWIIPPTDPSGRIDDSAFVIESLWKTIEHPWWDSQKDGNEVSIWRYENMTRRQADVIINRARMFVGAKYGWWKLAAHFIDNKVLDGRLCARKLLRVDGRPICSYTVARSFHCGGVRTGIIPAGAQSPDSMWDYVGKRPLWYEVGRGVVRKEA